ncbi:MAG: InlB B-repeat-containing protein, partial [Clostridia bacterium]|nr:InlB B-repeat-containing protein [Clostridia bacterium]
SYSNNDKNAFPIPTKTGYAFDGWYSGENGTGNKVVNEYGAIDSWNIPNDCTLYAHYTPMHYQITFDFCGGSSEVSTLEVIYDQALPYAVAPTRTGYTFVGYFDNIDGNGTRYYNSEMLGLLSWTNTSNITLYAHWMANNYTVKLNAQGGSGGSTEFTVTFGQPLPSSLSAPTRMGYYFKGYYSDFDGRGTCYLDDYMRPNNNWDIAHDTTLYANWEIRTLDLYLYYAHFNGEYYDMLDSSKISISGSESKILIARDFDGYTFSYWKAVGSEGQRRKELEKVSSSTLTINFNYLNGITNYRNIFIYAYYDKNCVAEGTMITLADGSQKAVEDLTGNEQLLVWNLMTGKFDIAPILFIDSDQLHNYQVINLHFSDGTIVKVISEHAFWDFDLNKYVFLRRDADKYIGHWFNKQLTDSDGNMTWGKVQLTDVQIKYETTRAYSPVTYSHLCYYVNGMLSMPGATEGLINIFEVDSETMKIDVEQFNADIEKYGIYTYEEFAKIIPVTEEVFNAFNGMYLKVAIGKGLITIE